MELTDRILFSEYIEPPSRKQLIKLICGTEGLVEQVNQTFNSMRFPFRLKIGPQVVGNLINYVEELNSSKSFRAFNSFFREYAVDAIMCGINLDNKITKQALNKINLHLCNEYSSNMMLVYTGYKDVINHY